MGARTLNGEQIGKLWDHLVKAIKENPNEMPHSSWPVFNDDGQPECEPWEAAFKIAVNSDEALPSYDELQGEFLDDFIELTVDQLDREGVFTL